MRRGVVSSSVESNTYIGPEVSVVTSKDREKYPLGGNETCSQDWQQLSGKTAILGREQFQEFSDPIQRVINCREAIHEHIERRVAIFFQQLVCAFKTDLHFEEGKTTHQGKGEGALTLSNGEQRTVKVEIKRNAAHSSTLPALTAYHGNEWREYENKRGAKPKGFVFMKDSDLWRISNATMDLPIEINNADREIDEKWTTSVLRQRSLAILNRCSRGEVTPKEGLEAFFVQARAVTQHRERSVTDQAVKKALEFYDEDFDFFAQGLKYDETFLDSLLNVRVDRGDEAAKMRQAVYQLRFKAIQQLQLDQSELLQKVNEVAKGIFAKVGKPVYHQQAFRHLLVRAMPTLEDQRRVRKMYNLPGEGLSFSSVYKLRTTQSRQGRFDKAVTAIEPHIGEIQVLARELSVKMQQLRIEDYSKRGAILRHLRRFKGWSQQRLGEKIREIFPNVPSSQTTISRSERMTRAFFSEFVTQLARVFKVDECCFIIPNFYT
ncbi:MAG: helix-turn-helix transcriptional regulator [Verrucomicrobia bacterium]|nr:helix-turn-helix transcriptional regulator [Verrucomicrobiota bacterium]